MIVGGTPAVKYRHVESLSVAFHLPFAASRASVCTLIYVQVSTAKRIKEYNIQYVPEKKKPIFPDIPTQHIDPLAFKLTSVPWFPARATKVCILYAPKPAFKSLPRVMAKTFA